MEGHRYVVGEEEEEDEEETLSLCDLPVSASNGDNTQQNAETAKALEAEDFDFGSWGERGTVLMETEMCAADEVFFQGQMLPLRNSVSSESATQASRCASRSESMDHSLSSRSNSTGSHNSTSTSTVSTTSTSSTYTPKFRNQFHSHSHPSPKPQIAPGPRHGNVTIRCRKSNVWSLFKVGVVRTPEMELQELKLRSISSSSSSRKSDLLEMKPHEEKKKKKADRFIFDGCQCSADAVETVIILKNKKSFINERERKQVEEKKGVTEKQRKQGKQALHHRRTFEWLKDLSIADVPQEL